jgi:hypothetical protein
MNPRELVLAALRGDDLSVRQQVKEASREGFRWTDAPAPEFAGRRAQAVYASLVELFASRAGQTPPAWTARVGKAPAPLFLVRAAKRSRAMRRESLSGTPESLKKRNVFALPDYLDVL